MSIGKKISGRRKELGLTLEEIGSLVGVSKSTVQKWESGYISNMRRDKIPLLAKALKMNPSELIEDDTAEPSNISDIFTEGIYKIPVFETVSAGFGAYASSDIIDYIPVFVRNPSEVPNLMGIRVSGDSMYPKIEDGDIIVVHKQSSVDSGSIAVMLLDGEEGLVKKVEYGSDWIDLVSINPEYKTKHFEGAEVLRLQVVGLVKQVIKML